MNTEKKIETRRWRVDLLIAVIALVMASLSVIITWPELKNYVPFLPKPLLRITYQHQGQLIIVLIENIGNAPANYITADITGSHGNFSINDSGADFELSTSGKGGGTWKVISCKNILPQQKGHVSLFASESTLVLNPPKVLSDSRYIFMDVGQISYGPVETQKATK
jgi:hypothetical protein